MAPNISLTSLHGQENIGANPQRVSISMSLLALLIPLMLSGALDIISNFERSALWGIWLIMWVSILINGFRPQERRFFQQTKLFLGWLFLYCVWGVLVSTMPVWDDALRSCFYALTAAAAIHILGSNQDAWRRMATISAWIIILNLLIALSLQEFAAVQAWMYAHDIAHAKTQWSWGRFSGLWADPNEAGLQILLLVVLSSWSSARMLWLGRFAAIWFTYMLASRTTTYCFLLVGGIYFFYYIGQTRRGRLVAVVLACLLFLGVFAEIDPMSWFHTYETDSLFWTRIMDPLENQSRNHYTRFYLMKLWLRYLDHAPWYGLGFNAMHGGSTGYLVFRTDIPNTGTHNMYLGIWADTGLLGLISYIAILIVAGFAAFKARLSALDRVAFQSFWMILLVFSMFLHGLNYSKHGLVMYLLVFMLPALPIFQERANTNKKDLSYLP